MRLKDGRHVQVEEYGDLSGVPALWFHGAGASRLEAFPLDGPARQLGLRVLSLDRPGCGGSDPHAGRSIASWVADVEQVLNQLGIEQAAVGGLSAGGSYAMAVASLLPGRVSRAVPYNPASPIADAAALAALSRKARVAYSMMKKRPEYVVSRTMAPPEPGRVLAALSRRSDPDQHLYDDPAVAAGVAAAEAELRRQPGGDYLRQELALVSAPWGFDHRAVAVPVRLVSGEKDPGLGYARVWAKEVPCGRLVVVPGGHRGMPNPVVARRIVELLRGDD